MDSGKTIRFIFSGASAALSKLIIFLVLFSFFGMWYLLSSALAFSISVAAGFFLQKYFTFKSYSSKDIKKQSMIFIFVSIINLLINIILMYYFVEILKFNKILAQVVTIGIIACWNFFAYQKFVFKTKNPTYL